MSIFIGIEGVGLRQSVAVAASQTGEILSSYRMIDEPLSLHTMDRRVFRVRLQQLIREVSSRADRQLDDLEDAVICIGLSGVTFPYDAEVDLPSEFERLEIKIERLICTGDAEIIFASHSCSDTGSAIISHMGSTAYVTLDGKSARSGGWGPAIDDAGSGHWIGQEALKAIENEYDSGREASDLWKAIDLWLTQPWQSTSPILIAASIAWRKQRAQFSGVSGRLYDPRTALFHFSHSMSIHNHWQWRVILSSLTIPVMKAWDNGNTTATQIVTRAADRLVRQYKQACLQVQASNPISPLVLYGGVLTHHPRFQDVVLKKLTYRRIAPETILTPSCPDTMRPAMGALLFALGQSKTGALQLPDLEVIKTMRLDQRRLHTTGELQND